MARSFSAKKSKSGKEIKCGRCGAKIEPGEQYFYFSVGFRGSKQIRCKLHSPRQSELTGSKMSGAYAANEDLSTALNTAGSPDDVGVALEEAGSAIEGVRDEYQESFDSLPENFQNASTGEEIQEKIDGLTEYAEKLSEAADSARSVSADPHDVEEPGVDASEEERQDYEAALEAAQDEADEQALDDAKQIAEDAMGEFSL